MDGSLLQRSGSGPRGEASRDFHLGTAAAEVVREEIRRAQGNEVCFLTRPGAGGELLEPVVVARGNGTAVLAAVRAMEAGGVVLHNHPSGDLTPSDADLDVAERLWSEGFGFAITDNAAGELYVVVAPPAERALLPLDPGDIEADLAPGGPLSRSHVAYEDRPDQRALARLIAGLYHDEGVGIAEAGTGTGKSIAYLVPAIHWAARNRERTVVSTNTINLQEQLVEKDLPFLRRALGIPFRFALVKGRNNYVSIRRARLAALSAASLFPDGREKELEAIVEWVDQTRDGSLSDLPFRPSPEVWDEVASESDVCLRARCPHFEDCFYQRSRRDAASADVLVVNHHLLFSDLAVRRAASNYSATAVLPHYKRLILDEAHNLEETATQHLGANLSRRGFHRVLRRLEHRGKGVLPSLEKALRARASGSLAEACVEIIHQRLRPELEGAWKRGAAVFQQLEGVLRSQPSGILRVREDFAGHPVWAGGMEEDLSAALAHLGTLVQGMEAVRERIATDEQAAEALEEQLLELRGVGNRVAAISLALRGALRPAAEAGDAVRWAELRVGQSQGSGERPQANVVVAAAPLDLGGLMREALFDRVPTVVLTSATLATGGDFRFLRSRLGLEDDLPVEEAIYPSPFDFQQQSLLVVPRDLPVPSNDDDRRHADATVRVTLELAAITDGGLFVLFTSHRALRAAASALRARGMEGRWPLYVQGEAPRAQLLASFTASERGILLGTASFWEGVDVPGSPLRGIVIPRLPFKVPSEPVTEARLETIAAGGGNAFLSYMLPHAAIRLKQGFGRLIRSREDRGAVVILDGRLVTMRYGEYLLRSLPPAGLVAAPWRACHEALTAFYAGDSEVGRSLQDPAFEAPDQGW